MSRKIIIFRSRRHAVLRASSGRSKRTLEPAPRYGKTQIKAIAAEHKTNIWLGKRWPGPVAQHRDTAMGRGTGTQHRDMTPGHSNRRQYWDTASGHDAGTQHRDMAPGHGTRT